MPRIVAGFSTTNEYNYPSGSYDIFKMCDFIGLDPAQPYFQGTPTSIRLDKSDAEFVDVIHTDSAPTIPYLGKLAKTYKIRSNICNEQVECTQFNIIREIPGRLQV